MIIRRNDFDKTVDSGCIRMYTESYIYVKIASVYRFEIVYNFY